MKMFSVVIALLIATPTLADIRDEIYYTAQEIQDQVYRSTASTDELREAERHLMQAMSLLVGSGGDSGHAQVQYMCDASSNLKISLISETGSVSQESFYIGDQTLCRQQADVLRASHARVDEFAVIGVCDGSGYHRSFRLKEQGGIDRLAQRYLGSRTFCQSQAAAINQQARPTRYHTFVQHLCDESGYLYLDAHQISGNASSSRLYVGSRLCREQASAMLERHSYVEDFAVIGACNESYYLHRFAVSRNFTELQRTYIGAEESCLTQARLINTTVAGNYYNGISHFLCDESGYLNLYVTSRDGVTARDQEYIGSKAACQNQVARFAAGKMFFQNTLLADFCDTSGYFYRFLFRSNGTLENIARDYMGDYESCLAQVP